jgi:hypothetical protein
MLRKATRLDTIVLDHQMCLVQINHQISELWQEAVEEEREDETEQRDGKPDRVDVIFDQGLHVNLKKDEDSLVTSSVFSMIQV